MAVNINITPTIPNIIVSDNPSLITPDLSNYATLSTLDFTSGILNESIIRSGSYLYNLINTSAAGVSSLNGSSGILLLKGTGSVYVTTNGQTITISGDGGNSQSVNLVGLISTGSADLRYYGISNPSQYIKSGEVINLYVLKSETGNFLSINQTGQFYPISNPYSYIRSGDIIGTYATISYVNLISGELANQIQMGGGGGSGIESLNSLDGAVNLISSTDTILFNNTGNNINIRIKQQNTQIYRNELEQITGVNYNADFARIYRNISDKITGIFYNNYYLVENYIFLIVFTVYIYIFLMNEIGCKNNVEWQV